VYLFLSFIDQIYVSFQNCVQISKFQHILLNIHFRFLLLEWSIQDRQTACVCGHSNHESNNLLHCLEWTVELLNFSILKVGLAYKLKSCCHCMLWLLGLVLREDLSDSGLLMFQIMCLFLQMCFMFILSLTIGSLVSWVGSRYSYQVSQLILIYPDKWIYKFWCAIYLWYFLDFEQKVLILEKRVVVIYWYGSSKVMNVFSI
jgi:hypothetical protein